MSESSPIYAPGTCPDTRPVLPGTTPLPERAVSHQELTIREYELRRLQGAIEAIVGAESRIRHGLNGERPQLCHLGLDTIREALVVMDDVIRLARPADLRPDLSEAYLAQVVDDLSYVEAVAAEHDETTTERHVERARAHLNAAILARVGVAL